jgi:hypothetical protein
MVQIVDNFPRRRLQILEIDQQPDLIQLLSTNVDLDLIVMAVRILALSLVASERVRRGETHLDHYFMCWHNDAAPRENYTERRE